MQVSRPGSISSPDRSSVSGDAGRRHVRRILGVGDVRLDLEDVQHPPRADEGARDLVDSLRGRPQRDHEEGGVTVEGDQLADVDLPRDREAGAEPRDQHDEEARDEDLRRVERRLRQRDPDARLPHHLRAVAIAVEERVLAADPAQHAQAGGGVGAERGELADLVTLLALPLLQRLDHEGEQQDEHRDAEQDDQTEHGRRRQAG